tara:strand:- start:601 stop:1245 length:645 start_codon:yes stop_codon:yes gene_type:complete
MANIFNEIDEDIRKEKYKNLWDKFGKYLIGLILLIVIIFSANQFNQLNSISKNKKVLEMYFNATEEIEKNQIETAENYFEKIYSESNKTLAAFSKFKLSSFYYLNDKKEKSQNELISLYNDSSIDDLYRELALYKYMLISLDSSTIEELKLELASLPIINKKFEPYFQEIFAIKYLLLNQNDKANIIFKDLMLDNSTPFDLKIRLEKLLLISEQ